VKVSVSSQQTWAGGVNEERGEGRCREENGGSQLESVAGQKGREGRGTFGLSAIPFLTSEQQKGGLENNKITGLKYGNQERETNTTAKHKGEGGGGRLRNGNKQVEGSGRGGGLG